MLKSARVAAVVVAATAVVSTIAGPASAATPVKPSVLDRVAIQAANRQCVDVDDDVSFEDCVLGEFMLQRERYVDDTMYAYNGRGDIVLLHRSLRVPAHKATAPHRPERRAMAAANRQCAPITDDVSYEDCVMGEFMLTRQRFAGDDMVSYDARGRIVLTEHSVRVK